MNIVDLLVTIVVVTILVTIILAIVTYVAYKLRLSREPASVDEPSGPQYFVPYEPPAADVVAGPRQARPALTAAETESDATEA